MSLLDARLRPQLQALRERDRYRLRRVIEGSHGVNLRVDGRDCINFCSNDYLGLAGDARIAQAAQRALSQTGTGSGAAALVSGYNREHAALEQALAEHLGRPRVLLFSSGWAANLGVLRALLGRDDVLVADELNHASLIDGGRLSQAQYRRVEHARLDGWALALQRVALEAPESLRLAVSDSLFSMDGDLADVPALCRLARASGASAMVDDAHGFGVLGPQGRGCVAHFQALGEEFPEPEVYVGTLGKALGCSGAFVAGSDDLIEFLIQRARTWVFSTAPAPAMAAAARESLRICAEDESLRERLRANIERFRVGASERRIALGSAGLPASNSAIQPVVLGPDGLTMAVSRALMAQGYWVAGIRPPTVPEGTARLRITLSAAHGFKQIDGLLDALAAALAQASQAA